MQYSRCNLTTCQVDRNNHFLWSTLHGHGYFPQWHDWLIFNSVFTRTPGSFSRIAVQVSSLCQFLGFFHCSLKAGLGTCLCWTSSCFCWDNSSNLSRSLSTLFCCYVENIVKVRINDTHCLPLADRSSHFVIKDSQADKEWFPHRKCVLLVFTWYFFLSFAWKWLPWGHVPKS